MPFVPSGKKADRRRAAAAKAEARERLIDEAVGRAQFATQRSNLCLQTCVLLERILKELGVPPPAFSLKLGSLRVYAEEERGGCTFFDPRDEDVVPAGFHTWLEDANGQLLDPTILVTLLNEGYEVDATTYFIAPRRTTAIHVLRLVYEELADLELLAVEESEPAIRALMDLAMRGVPPKPFVMPLDIGWRGRGPLPR